MGTHRSWGDFDAWYRWVLQQDREQNQKGWRGPKPATPPNPKPKTYVRGNARRT